MYRPAQKRKAELSLNDKREIKKVIKELFKKSQSKRQNIKPEKEIENNFKIWLINDVNEDFDNMEYEFEKIINFRSNSRKGSKWENVDGYLVEPRKLKYFLSFRPKLTTYEIKASEPSITNLKQAENYLSFSHEAYIVFKSSKNLRELQKKYNDIEDIGMYYTNDGKEFIRLKAAKEQNIDDKTIDEFLEKLLSKSDKEELEKSKLDYLQTNISNMLTK